nr:FAD/NAD(P)-binding protein [uncultured Sphingosinicella sp.]
MNEPHVAIVGGGYSGTLQTIELLNRGARVTLIERAPLLARGVAYGTAHSDHLLNVRAQGMSAFAERPSHFADWLTSKGLGGPSDFAPRQTYGAYLGELLEGAKAKDGDRLHIVRGEAIDLTTNGVREVVRLRDGNAVEADTVILALGNLPPEPPRGIDPDALGSGIYASDPWKEDIAAGLASSDTVLLIGTGLTAVDAALALDSAGFDGRILALSRRGLLPRAHSDVAVSPPALEKPIQPRTTELVRYVRSAAKSTDWRSAVDSLRPVTQALWSAAGDDERRRFLRHLRPWWDVHRHRIAPSISARIHGMQRSAQLEVAGGKILSVSPEEAHALAHWRPRGSGTDVAVRVRRIVNCTGPQADIRRAGEPLLDALLASGRITPDAQRIGIDVDADYRARDSAGSSARKLYAIGPMTRAALWEIVAVPDIREQVRSLAVALTSTGA